MVINKTRIKTTELFLESPFSEYSIREIAIHTKINYKLVYQEIIKMQKEGLVSIKKKGAVNLCQINLKTDVGFYSYIENLRQHNFQDKHPEVKVIVHELNKIKSVYFTAVIFGSYVQGKNKKGSDLDLLFIIPRDSSTEDFEKELQSYLQILSYPLDINVISEKSFLEMKKEEGLNIVNELINNHLILKGGEFYYQLLAK